MLKKISQLNGVQVLDKDQLRKVSGGHMCPGNLYHYEWNGYHGCCIDPIGPFDSPCGRTDCLIHVDACDWGQG